MFELQKSWDAACKGCIEPSLMADACGHADQVSQTKGDEQQEAVAARQDGAPHLWRPPQPPGW